MVKPCIILADDKSYSHFKGCTYIDTEGKVYDLEVIIKYLTPEILNAARCTESVERIYQMRLDN